MATYIIYIVFDSVQGPAATCQSQVIRYIPSTSNSQLQFLNSLLHIGVGVSGIGNGLNDGRDGVSDVLCKIGPFLLV